MLTFLLSFHFLLAVLIIGLVLIQKHESDGILGTGGSAGKVFSVRGQANLLSRSTAVLMTLFFLNCIVMAKMVKHSPRTKSLIDEAGDMVSSTRSDRFSFPARTANESSKNQNTKQENDSSNGGANKSAKSASSSDKPEAAESTKNSKKN